MILIFYRDYKVDIPLIFSGFMIIFVSSSTYFEDSWVNLIYPYVYYFIIGFLALFLCLNIKKISFHPSTFLLILFMILFSSIYKIEIHYLINFIVTLCAYKVLLKDFVIKKYRLLHIANIITLLFILCV